jgi:hypothetical protein
MTRRKRIEAAAESADMTRDEMHTVIRLTKTLTRDHQMCTRCAFAAATALIDNNQPDDPPNLELCSDACTLALDQFYDDVAAIRVRIAARAPSSSRRDH